MELTPLRNRSKRGATPWSRARHRTAGHDQKTKIQKATQKNISRLEKLSRELVERIFLASENLALPRCSRTLYHKLGSESVKQQLLIAAFSPTWDTWYDLPFGDLKSYHGWEKDNKRVSGDPKFQSVVMACSWVSVDTFFSAYETWARQEAGDRLYWLSMERRFDYTRWERARTKRYFRGPTSSTAREEFSKLEKKYHEVATQEGYYLPFMEAGDIVRYIIHRDIHPDIRIPDALLTGPFDWEMAHLLLLLATQMSDLRETKLDWELTRVGFQNIVASAKDDLKLARYLTTLWLVVMQTHKDWPEHVFNEEIARITSLYPAEDEEGDLYDLYWFRKYVVFELQDRKEQLFQ